MSLWIRLCNHTYIHKYIHMDMASNLLTLTFTRNLYTGCNANLKNLLDISELDFNNSAGSGQQAICVWTGSLKQPAAMHAGSPSVLSVT